MAEDKKPRFLQQTTSQLLHQQEALRKRREMLERESTKPPAMRFGTNTPPRGAGRHGRSAALPSTACERHASHSAPPPPPPSSGVHRELNWGRSENEKAAERAPVCFSTLLRPSPTPAGLTRPRSATSFHTPPPPSPRPREVNTSDQVDTIITRLHKEPSLPRTVSPRSPVSQRSRVEHDCASSKNAAAHLLAPDATRAGQATAAERTQTKASQTPTHGATPAHAAVERHTSTPKPLSQEALVDEQDETTGMAAFSNTFPVPRFTPISPVVASDAKRAQQTSEGEHSTPARFAVGEFRTPRPLARPSNAATPVVGCPASVPGEGVAQQVPLALDDEAETRPTPSPIPVPLPQARVSADACDVLQQGARPTLRDGETHTSTQHHDTKIAAPHDATCFSLTAGDASPHRQTSSPPHRNKASPVPTAQDLIHSVQVSAEKRPCGCERATPSPENWPSRRATATPSRTGSPPPMPVPTSDEPMTDFGAPTQKCCDRPTPASLSSQPAGGDVRHIISGASSASPWPTTENIINSIMAGCGEGQRRRGEDRAAAAAAHELPREDDGGALERSSCEEANVSHTNSHTVTVPEMLGTNADNGDEAYIRSDVLRATLEAHAPTHTPSPVPSDRQYGQSVVASAEKRRCGRPTPPERHVSVATPEDSNGHADRTTSASPQLCASHLLDSLEVSVDKGGQRCKPAERPSEAEGSGTGDATAGEAAGRLAGLRTPSPTPTPEHVIASLQASAEKRTRSGALDTTSGPGGSSAAAATSPSCSSYQSPTLTPQNVKDSMQKLMREQQQAARSDAPAPIRPWAETPKGIANTASGADLWNSSASPVVTAENVDITLDTLERDQRYHSRSSRAPQVADISPEEPNATRLCDSVVSPMEVAEAAAPEDMSRIPAPSPEVAALASVVSPVPSEFAVASAMFFDCVSVPPTPALENVEATTRDLGSPESTIRGRECAHVPPQFYDLQREVAAISEGRCRTRTPPPVQVCELRSPLPVSTTPLAEEDTPRAEASMEQAEVAVSAPLHHPPNAISSCSAAADKDAEEEAMARRSSLILVHPTAAPQALLQHPHKPMPAAAPPSISPVQVPRAPTPQPRRPLQQDLFLTGEHCESPLPRPVSLRSQVSLVKPVQLSHGHQHSRSPALAWGASCTFPPQNGGMRAPLLQTGARPPAHYAAAVKRDKDPDQQAGLLDSQNDWMDLVEPLRPHTITVSPQGGSVVYTEHSSIDLPRNREGPAGCVSPSSSRKRSRSAQTPLAASRQMAATTPASIALTMDDGVLSGSRSLHVVATPPSHVSQTPRSSTRGRKSQAEELLEMLPAEVVAEVARIETAEEVAAAATAAAAASADSHGLRPSLGSSDGRLSGVSDGDSTLGLLSTISQRVSQRPRRVYHNDDYYIQYLEGIATSSASKARKAAGRRIHRAVMKDVASATVKTIVQRAGGDESPASARVSPAESPALRGSRRQSASPRGGGSAVARAKASPKHASEEVTLSPQTPSPTRVGGRGQLKVSTRLSAELQKALFQQPSPAKPKRQRGPRGASPNASTKSTKAAKKSPTPSPKSGPSPSSTTKGKTAKTPTQSTRGKKSVKKFVTAKSMRRPRRGAKHGKA
ncbi:conserved hypothetical protein [Leishmania major strain Friedlin]|uniref:Uncharacterized protein n=1 Tax=Leishmania major TaxID=5664 RepID=Q4Q5G9_LEIMA|nr:conserved hypothetical protein [Leishmania major strain Friedlin]CAG9580155.1 hypothetical_protein_-_conserved [Leishmania major strain Friedlin]CAJ08633.1 conserved hypothetical protein [Leishmania major strain Friedlin]|eukprot:XP_001685429.1 conserved hypothetical protein [Leishmania major strain Friedlin]